MSNRKREKIREQLKLGAIDLFAFTTAYFTAYSLRFWSGLFSTYLYVPIDYYLYAWPVTAGLFLGSFYFLGLYENRRPADKLTIFMDCLKATTLGSLLALPFSFWIRAFSFSRWVFILNGILLVVLSTLLRVLYQRVLERRRRKGHDVAPLLIVGAGEAAGQVVETLKAHPELGYRIVGVLKTNGQSEDPPGGLQVLGTLKDLVPTLHREQVEEVVLADENLEPEKEFLIVQPCRAENIRIRIVPSLYDFALSVRGLRVIDHLFWYSLEPTVSERWYAFLKRALDIFISLMVLIPVTLLFPLIALLIKMESSGPVVFSQMRTGTNGKPFRMYKFRSMVQNAEDLLPKIVNVKKIDRPAFKMENDPRVTRVGRFLRRYSLDELPQFYNVLRGEMSLVGPRPEELWIASKYDEKERARLQVKPGLTGFQQIHCRGSENFDDRLRHDLYYINNRSFFLDLSIIIETFGVVIKGKGIH
jgi:exopolysaccharide biosynthesis polyprenyl glycosylphosphotransferase